MLLTESIERLASFEPGPYAFLSLYLNTQPDQHGRDNISTFLRKELDERLNSYRPSSPEHDSLRKDIERIRRYVDTELQPSANGLAIFACAGADVFEAIQLAAPVAEHELYVSDQPHLYPLARLGDRYPRYAAVLVDSNRARILVVAGREVERAEEVTGTKTRRSAGGGWSQARFQRHVENFQVQHAKEVADRLDRLVREEAIDHIVLSGDEVTVPMLRKELAPAVAERVVDVVKLPMTAPDHEVLETTLEALRRDEAASDRDKVDRAIGAWRARGLGVVGARPTIEALQNGQVDEVLITADRSRLASGPSPEAPGPTGGSLVANGTAKPAGDRVSAESDAADALAEQIVTLAARTNAKVTFVEDPELLAGVGGVAALLRFRI